jgi:hypothetical protein
MYERHFLMAHLAVSFNPQKILDFGGEGFLSSFMNPQIIVDTVNINNKGNIPYRDTHIDLHDKSYDVVVSLDTFEHVDPKLRPVLLDELCRVARTSVIIATPYGSMEHIQYERELLANLPSTTNQTFRQYLKEHIDYGLPTKEEMENYFQGIPTKYYYAGRFDTHNLSLNGWQRWYGIGERIFDNFRLSPNNLMTQPFKYCNRIYCVAGLRKI